MDNISPERGRLDPWPQTGPPVLWRTNVGTGFSSIAVQDGRLYTLGNAQNTDTVFCLDATNGALVWSHSYPASLDPVLYEGGPSSTPTVHEGHLYSLGKAGDLFCFNATNGSVVWSKKLIADFGVRVAEWGFASSPLIVGEKLILNAGGKGIALNKNSGDLMWLTDTNRAGYATPILTEFDGQAALIMFCRREVAAVTLESGVTLWSTSWQTQYDQNCTDPILHNGSFLISSWTHAGTMLRFDGGILRTNWQNNQLSSPLSPGVKIDHYLYAFHGPTDSGSIVTCIDLDTGATRWAMNGYPIGSLISVGGRLVLLCGNGALVLAEADPDRFQHLAGAYILPGRCWAMPIFVDGVLYARDASGNLVALAMPWTPDQAEQPSLRIAVESDRVSIRWSAGSEDFALEQRRLPWEVSNWTPVHEAPIQEEGENVVVQTPEIGSGKVYRLRSN